MNPEHHTERVAVVGLGYVGLPLALEFGRHYPTVGFDIDEEKVAAYRRGRDPSGELPASAFSSTGVDFSSDQTALDSATAIVVAVPTPIDETRRPDLSALRAATELVGRHLARGALVVFESTVYPGATEEVCLPLLERASGLVARSDFHLGYSPERINPGDTEHGLADVVKVVAGRDADALSRVEALYRPVVRAGLHRAPSIAVAEAAKVLENTQRDLNIALMNEIALICARAGIDTQAVIDAASTKWNFAAYRPGLVGGHCIGVDPYYLTYFAERLGYHPEVIHAGRRVNDGMGHFVGRTVIKELIAAGKNVIQSRLGVLGLTFKENVSDLRNSRVLDVVSELREHGVELHLADPHAPQSEVEPTFGLPLTPLSELRGLDGIVLAVPHRAYEALSAGDLRALCRQNPVLIDVRARVSPEAARAAGFRYSRL